MAAIVTPRAPFFEWSESVLGQDDGQCGPEEFRSVLLLPERAEINDAFKEAFADIFDEMLVSSVHSSAL